MKQLTIFCACLLSLTIAAQHNKHKHSFYLQGGYRSSLFIKENGDHHLVSETESHQHKCIVFNTGVLFYAAQNWRVGASFTYDHFGTKHRSVEHSNLSYLLRCDRVWKEKSRYLLYSGLMLGVRKTRRFEEEEETGRQTAPAYHVCLIGAEYKLMNRVFIDVNAGYGVAGIVSIGAKFRF